MAKNRRTGSDAPGDGEGDSVRKSRLTGKDPAAGKD